MHCKWGSVVVTCFLWKTSSEDSLSNDLALQVSLVSAEEQNRFSNFGATMDVSPSSSSTRILCHLSTDRKGLWIDLWAVSPRKTCFSFSPVDQWFPMYLYWNTSVIDAHSKREVWGFLRFETHQASIVILIQVMTLKVNLSSRLEVFCASLQVTDAAKRCTAE